MKKTILSAALGFLILSVSSLQAQAFIRSGPTVSGGGDSCLLSLQASAAIIEEYSSMLTSLDLAGISSETFKKKLSGAKFETGTGLMKDGHKVDALNFPLENRIEVEKAECKNLIVNRNALLSLLLHETLGLLQKDDTNYKISKNALNDLNRILPGITASSGSALLSSNEDESLLTFRGQTARQVYEKLDSAESLAADGVTLLKSGKQMSCSRKKLATGPEYECVTQLEEATGAEIKFTGSFSTFN